MEIRRTAVFDDWFNGLKDRQVRNRIFARLHRLASGNPGDHAGVGEGVMELRLHFGPGYRVYYVQRGDAVIIVLGGGDKSTQAKDIEKAKALAREV